MPVCANCGGAFLDGEFHQCGPTTWGHLWQAVRVILMVCGAIFIALVILLIGVCGGFR